MIICNLRKAPKYELGQARFAEVREDLEQSMLATNSHQLLRALEAASILDCADMAAAASLFRTECAGVFITCARTMRNGTTTTGFVTRYSEKRMAG